MDWDKLKLFYITAKIGNISKAARELNVTQSALSRRISSLEEDLKTQLLNRHLRGVTLTHQGQIIFPEIEKAFLRLESLDHLIQSIENRPAGSLKIASNFGFIDTWLNYYIPPFLKQYPEINLSILVKDQNFDLVDEGIDIVIASHFSESPLMTKEYFMTWHRCLYASPAYLKTFGSPKSTQDLSEHRLISFGPSNNLSYGDRDWHLKIGTQPGEKREPYLTINSIRALLHAAEHDLGIISFSQESILLRESILTPVLPKVQGPKIDIYMYYLQQHENLEKMKVFRSYIKEQAQSVKKEL